MAKVAVEGDLCRCTTGSVPCRLVITDPFRKMKSDGKKVAIETDASAMNLQGFGMCSNLSNPAVAQATAAAQGILTPAPCMPVLIGCKWKGALGKLHIDGKKAVGENCTTECAYGGCISISGSREKKIKSD